MTFTEEQVAHGPELSAIADRPKGVRLNRPVRVLIVGGLVALLLVERTFWEPDTLLVVLVVGGAVLGLTRQMLVRFAPLMAILIVFDEMRGWADKINTSVHYLPSSTWTSGCSTELCRLYGCRSTCGEGT